MNLKSLFKLTRSSWVRYSSYEYRTDEKTGQTFITPTQGAKVADIYDSLKDADEMVADALNIGMMCVGKKPEADIKTAVLDFVSHYGLLGFITALPTTPEFMAHDTVYFFKNPIMREEALPSIKYTERFFPFEKLEIEQQNGNTKWEIENDTEMMALSLTLKELPMAVMMAMHRAYSEPYEWVKGQLKDWAVTFLTSIFYYDEPNEAMREVQRHSIHAFGGVAPSYHIVLEERPVLVWEFYSLLRAVQILFSFAVTDEDRPLRLCKNCQKVFIAGSPRQEYCGKACRTATKEKKP